MKSLILFISLIGVGTAQAELLQIRANVVGVDGNEVVIENGDISPQTRRLPICTVEISPEIQSLVQKRAVFAKNNLSASGLRAGGVIISYDTVNKCVHYIELNGTFDDIK
jgi:hypothetical protein